MYKNNSEFRVHLKPDLGMAAESNLELLAEISNCLKCSNQTAALTAVIDIIMVILKDSEDI